MDQVVHPHKRTNWTPQENELLRQLVEKHTPHKEIAKILNRSSAGVREQCGRLGLYLQWTKEEIRELKQLLNERVSDQALAIHFKRSVNAIIHKRRSLGYTSMRNCTHTKRGTKTYMTIYVTKEFIERATGFAHDYGELISPMFEAVITAWMDQVEHTDNTTRRT